MLLRSHTVGLKAYWRRSFRLRLDGSVIDGCSNTTGHAACNQGKNGAKWGINEGLTQRAKSMFHHVLLAKKEGPPDRQTIKNVGWITTPLWRCYIDERDCTAQQLKEGAQALERVANLVLGDDHVVDGGRPVGFLCGAGGAHHGG